MLVRGAAARDREIRRRRDLAPVRADRDLLAAGVVAKTNSPSSKSTVTWSPALSSPCRICSDSWSSTSRCIARRSGRAPSVGSNPISMSRSLAASDSSTVMSRSSRRSPRRLMNRSTICSSSAFDQLREHDGVVDAVEELGLEVLLQLLVDLALHPVVRGRRVALDLEPDGAAGDVARAEVGRHDDDRVLEVDDAALTVGQTTLFEDLQERVEDVGVSLLDLVEQHHARTACDAPSR